MVRCTLAWLAAAIALSSLESAQTYLPAYDLPYAPSDVVEPHPSQRLTIFYPTSPPTQPNGRYPTVLYSPAACFQEATESVASFDAGFGEFEPLTEIVGDNPGGGGGGPIVTPLWRRTVGCFGCFPHSSPGQEPEPQTVALFLAKALEAGWAVVSVGSVGHNSWPTCHQLEDCNTCNDSAIAQPTCQSPLPPGPGCRDTNLWYSPDGAEWDDFNVFWGEKDFTWARQWVAQNAAEKLLDNDRVVVCGTSTGAIYASFLAFGPNRAWDATHSAQSQQDTRVAAIVAFEPNIWVKSLSPSFAALHWPASTDPTKTTAQQGCGAVSGCFGTQECYNRRAGKLGEGMGKVPDGLLEESSISRWIRTVEPTERLTPAFIATSDVPSVATGFLHNANLLAYEEDYERYSGEPLVAGLVVGDPTISFASLNLHDSWHALNFQLDLQMLDATFHERYSRLYLQANTNWSFVPASMSKTSAAPQVWQDVIGLDGVFADEGVDCIENSNLAPKVICWMESVVKLESSVGIVWRNPPTVGPGSVVNQNHDVYTCPTVRSGIATDVEVDLTGLPNYELASVLIFDDPYPAGAELVLSAGQALLCNIGTYLFSLPFTAKDPSGPEAGIVHLTLGAASPPGLQFSTQAILVDVQHVVPFALTNAQDITVQPCL